MTQRALPSTAGFLASVGLCLHRSPPVASESHYTAGHSKEGRCFLNKALIGDRANSVGRVGFLLSNDPSPAVALLQPLVLPGLRHLSAPPSLSIQGPVRGAACCTVPSAAPSLVAKSPQSPYIFRKTLGSPVFLPLRMEGPPSDFQSVGDDRMPLIQGLVNFPAY